MHIEYVFVEKTAFAILENQGKKKFLVSGKSSKFAEIVRTSRLMENFLEVRKENFEIYFQKMVPSLFLKGL